VCRILRISRDALDQVASLYPAEVAALLHSLAMHCHYISATLHHLANGLESRTAAPRGDRSSMSTQHGCLSEDCPPPVFTQGLDGDERLSDSKHPGGAPLDDEQPAVRKLTVQAPSSLLVAESGLRRNLGGDETVDHKRGAVTPTQDVAEDVDGASATVSNLPAEGQEMAELRPLAEERGSSRPGPLAEGVEKETGLKASLPTDTPFLSDRQSTMASEMRPVMLQRPSKNVAHQQFRLKHSSLVLPPGLVSSSFRVTLVCFASAHGMFQPSRHPPCFCEQFYYVCYMLNIGQLGLNTQSITFHIPP
jgi:hypothetical protein